MSSFKFGSCILKKISTFKKKKFEKYFPNIFATHSG